ncbi:MAG: L-seryl-tRNA(Sec) selenium transferase [Candidatus Caldatribacteriota bacterium]
MKNNLDLKKQTNKLNLTLAQIPSVEILLQKEELKNLSIKYSRKILTQVIRKVISQERNQAIKSGKIYSNSERITRIKESLAQEDQNYLKKVINGSGVILHTNLGRAPLGKEILEKITGELDSYVNLEYDLTEGVRGKRGLMVERLITILTQAEKSLVVNNNAGAVFLILSALAKNKEVIVSRGELIQIGGGFRIPEILEQSGARLREVGTTNQTFIEDYEKAINEDTALLLKVHQSNFQLEGFTHQVKIRGLKELGKKYHLPVVVDLGSGTFLNTEDFGLKHEPTVQENIQEGADIVCFSTDKLLGGPQGGIICGKENYINTIATHPLFRTFRVGKITLAFLQEILLCYLKKQEINHIAIWKMISCPLEQIEKRAKYISQELSKENIPTLTEEGETAVGGGALPGQTLPTRLILIKPPVPVEEFSKYLRFSSPPLLGRKEKEYFVLDLRTIDPALDELVIEIIKSVWLKIK